MKKFTGFKEYASCGTDGDMPLRPENNTLLRKRGQKKSEIRSKYEAQMKSK